MPSSPALDLRPLTPVSDASAWGVAEKVLSELTGHIQCYLQAHGLKAGIERSAPGELPMVVVAEIWRPVAESPIAAVTERSRLEVSLHVRPLFATSILYRIR